MRLTDATDPRTEHRRIRTVQVGNNEFFQRVGNYGPLFDGA